MEPINSNNSNQAVRYNSRDSGSVAPTKTSLDLSERPKFVSPKGNIDPQSGVYVVQFRNASTGNVDFQYPNKKAVAEYTRSDKLAPADSSDGASQASASSASASVAFSSAGSDASQASSSSAVSQVSSAASAPAELGTTNND